MNFWYYFLAINVITIAAYRLDKYKAKWGHWRIPEKSLHVLAALGGSPAALLSCFLFRHKVRKTGFMLTIFFIIFAQIGGLIYWTENYAR